MHETVSIVIPCHNGSAYLSAAIESVLRQSCPAQEVIVVDDGSVDDSAAIAARFGPPIRVIVQKNRGVSIARNVGLAEATAEYVAFLDADDMYERRALEKQLSGIRDVPDGVAWMGCVSFVGDPGQPERIVLPWVDRFFPELIRTNLGVPHCWLFPRELMLRAGGFRPAMRISADWDCWCRVAMAGGRLVPVQHAGALYRKHAGSMTATMRHVDHAREHVALLEDLAGGFLQRPELMREFGYHAFWAGWTALHRARSFGVPWPELRGLAGALERIARTGPASVTQSRFSRLIRLLGVRWAETIRSAWYRDSAEPAEGRSIG